jgi:hypothetical protein
METGSGLKFYNSFFIDTKDRISGTPYDATIPPPTITNFNYLAVKKVSFPFNLYNVQASNGTFSIDYNSIISTVVIPQGNYDALTLRSALQTALQLVDPSFLVTYSNLTSKYTFTATLAFSFLLSSNYRTSQLLGFDLVDTPASNNVTSTYPINIYFTQYIDIICDQLLQFAYSSYSTSNSNALAKHSSKILKRVYVNDIVPFGQVNIIYDVPRLFDYSPHTNLQQLKLVLHDDQGQPLTGFNNANLSIQIDVYRI